MEKLVTYRPATADDWPQIQALLSAARLPLDGARDHIAAYLLGEHAAMPCCVGGYERYMLRGWL